MALTTLKDIFDKIKWIHQQAAEHCEGGAHSSDERLNMLADFFRKWEDRLGDYVDSLEADKQNAILGTWVPFPHSEHLDNALTALRRSERHDPDESMKLCFVLQNDIVAILEELADNLPMAKVRQLLLDVAKFEQQAARMLGSAELTKLDA